MTTINNTTTTTAKYINQDDRNESIQVLTIVNRIEAFNKLSLVDASDILVCASKHYYSPGSVIQIDTDCDSIYFILDGLASSKSSDDLLKDQQQDDQDDDQDVDNDQHDSLQNDDISKSFSNVISTTIIDDGKISGKRKRHDDEQSETSSSSINQFKKGKSNNTIEYTSGDYFTCCSTCLFANTPVQLIKFRGVLGMIKECD